VTMLNFVNFDLQLRSQLPPSEILQKLSAVFTLSFILDESHESEGMEIYQATSLGHEIRFCPLGTIDGMNWFSLSCQQGAQLDDLIQDDYQVADLGETFAIYLRATTKLDWSMFTEDDYARIKQFG
jgi:hypothetical protein